jgi:hypothetical protein
MGLGWIQKIRLIRTLGGNGTNRRTGYQIFIAHVFPDGMIGAELLFANVGRILNENNTSGITGDCHGVRKYNM